jgi:hypothetical protein
MIRDSRKFIKRNVIVLVVAFVLLMLYEPGFNNNYFTIEHATGLKLMAYGYILVSISVSLAHLYVTRQQGGGRR